MKKCSLWEAPMWEQLVKDCILYEGAGEQCEEEGTAKIKCYELTTSRWVGEKR